MIKPRNSKIYEDVNVMVDFFRILKATNGFLGRDVSRSGRSDKKSAARVAHCCEKDMANI